jgi:alpha-1,2-glucosyltransferase
VTGLCDVQSLRLLNAACLSLIGLAAFGVLQVLWETYHKGQDSVKRNRLSMVDTSTGWYLAHTAINICLFPPLFFFSGLYYTDIASTLVVLVSLYTQLVSQKLNWSLVGLQLLFAYGALFFRQTNIFWVGVFPLGVVVLDKCIPAVKDWKTLKDYHGYVTGIKVK